MRLAEILSTSVKQEIWNVVKDTPTMKSVHRFEVEKHLRRKAKLQQVEEYKSKAGFTKDGKVIKPLKGW